MPEEHGITLKSVKELMEEKVRFHVPYYQRGYRWKQEQVGQLLEDLREFQPTERHPFYFLQALVVARQEDGRCNVVDGQQRLTTLRLMLSKLSPEEREEQILLDYDRQADQAIDRFYKDQAVKLMPGHDPSLRERILACRFLWYEVPQAEELDAFSKLNSGRIPVRDSELVKCVMLSPGTDESPDVTRARAQEWDAMERMMRKEEFFAFMTPRGTWREEDRMTVLLRYAGFVPSEASTEVFPFLKLVQEDVNNKSRPTVWKKICAVYYRLTAWFENPLWYHAFGWFVHARQNPQNPWTMHIVLPNRTWNEDDDVYETRYGDVREWLFLHNVAYCRQQGRRYSFIRHRQVASWSVEHVFARNQRDLTQAELKVWIPNCSEEEWKSYSDECKQRKGNEWLAKQLGDRYPSDILDNSLKNLALLPQAANSSFNNSLFEGKRDIVVNRTYWIPPATEAVFLKALPGLSMTTPYWSEDDKKAYVEAMKTTIDDFRTEFSRIAGTEEKQNV